MTGGEEEQKKGQGKGFAGLSSLVSDVDSPPPPAAKTEPASVAPRVLHRRPLNRSRPIKIKRIKNLRRRHPLDRRAASGCWALPPSSACSGSSGSRIRAQPLPHRSTRIPRRPRRQLARRLLNRKCYFDHRDRCRPFGKTWYFQRLRFATAWPKTFAWKAPSPQSTTTSIRMWTDSTRWWPTSTAVAGASVIAAARWKVRDGTLSPTGASFSLKAEADLLVRPLARPRRQPNLVKLQPFPVLKGALPPALESLTYDEKDAIETACILKRSEGAATCNRCVVTQLRALGR